MTTHGLRFSLALLFLPVAAGTSAASFECGRARGGGETMICADATLSALDTQLDGLYRRARATPGEQRNETERQRAWLAMRDRCIGRTCVHRLYSLRLAALQTPARPPDFSGYWAIALRTPDERRQKRDCGAAFFDLQQRGERIAGDHEFATTGCGRLNEGGANVVQGIVIGSTAVLTVRSGRNGAVVLGTATRHGNLLKWRTIEELAPGYPEGDSPLILESGTLERQDRGT